METIGRATRAFVGFGLASLVFVACASYDPDSLDGRRRARTARSADIDVDEDEALPEAVTRDDDEIVDITVPDVDDTQMAPGETNGMTSLVPGQSPPIVLYLNKNGATISRGNNDSRANTSSIVRGTTTFPPSRYANNPTAWSRIVATVKEHFAAYNVTVVDQEPTSGNYLEAVVTSGSPSLIGYGDSLGGIAPSRCGVVQNSVVFVFDSRLRNEIHTAEVISHELGHSLSLSHTQTQTDLMSYTNRTPLKFENLAAQCGPQPGRSEPCNCGGSTQNNHAQLLQFVGAASQTPAPTPDTPPAGGETPPAATGSIAILSPANGSLYTPNSTVEIRADATKVTNIQRMVLRWQIGQQTYEYPCPGQGCSASGGVYTWRIIPGGGDRTFHARATTTSGQVVVSPSVTIKSSATPPPAVNDDDEEPAASDASAFCVAEINKYRAQVGAPPLARWDAAETCTANQARNDAASRRAHGSFGACNELAQNECPGWGGWSGDPKTVLSRCLAAMWAEGPGGGHYENMRNPRYTKVACSYYRAPNGQVTAIQNFR